MVNCQLYPPSESSLTDIETGPSSDCGALQPLRRNPTISSIVPETPRTDSSSSFLPPPDPVRESHLKISQTDLPRRAALPTNPHVGTLSAVGAIRKSNGFLPIATPAVARGPSSLPRSFAMDISMKPLITGYADPTDSEFNETDAQFVLELARNLLKPAIRRAWPLSICTNIGPNAREQAKDLLENEPVNHLAPTPHRPRKKKTGKQRAKATALEDVNSDPLEADSSQIAPSGPDGRFGLQPQAPAFVGRQALEEYEKDRVHHRTKDNTVARTGKGGVHSKQNSRNNSHDETTQMDIDDHHECRPEDEDHNSRMDVHARGGLFDFDDQQVEVPRSNGSHPRREDVIRDRNREDQMDTTGDPAPQGDARTQPPRRCPQSQPSQNTARDTAQPRRYVSNARYLQDRVLPSPPFSRSHSNEANENAHHNNDTQANVVRRGDERIFTTWLTFKMATIRTMVHRDNSEQDMKFPSLSKSIPPMFKVAIVKMIVHQDNTSQDMKFLSLNKSMPPPPPTLGTSFCTATNPLGGVPCRRETDLKGVTSADGFHLCPKVEHENFKYAEGVRMTSWTYRTRHPSILRATSIHPVHDIHPSRA
ncbi:hypothetical protein L210DRAFT_3499643 [Boletus edulis BED1]|uniref:Uncharacterized protein n=1 Tax=Boletus edulis BED1 TaxID=1328754 RepID=A0AAD4C9N7_BOLED|nr:hypothetical protein L210DRAFT_3499643 [Boletus edulis BED1]